LQSRIQTGLGVSIPATTAFDQPNIAALARFLLDKMLVFETAASERLAAALSLMSPKPVKPAKDFRVSAPDNRPLTLADFKGKNGRAANDVTQLAAQVFDRRFLTRRTLWHWHSILRFVRNHPESVRRR
jgi:hypothetical protein